MHNQSLLSHLIDRLKEHFGPEIVRETNNTGPTPADTPHKYKQLQDRLIKRQEHALKALGNRCLASPGKEFKYTR